MITAVIADSEKWEYNLASLEPIYYGDQGTTAGWETARRETELKLGCPSPMQTNKIPPRWETSLFKLLGLCTDWVLVNMGS